MVAAPRSLNTKPLIKKRKKKVKRYQSKQFKKVPESWRKPKGIDGRLRRRFKGLMKCPKIGFGSNKKTRNLLPNGFYEFLVHNPNELEMLVMNNRTHCATIAHNVAKLKRAAIVQRAAELNIRVTNANAKVRTQDDE